MISSYSEYQYLELLAHVLEKGDARIDRTAVGTRSIFGALARFNLSANQVPILTTKRVYWKTAIKEMLWFLSGSTSIRPLLQGNVRIWTDWPLAYYRKSTGEPISQEAFEERIVGDAEFARQWGDLGPVYGKQWRRWQGTDGREYDQIAEVIQTLKTQPASRRMLFHAWNVAELGAMALPPCHLLYQFHCTTQGSLNCLLYQRSGDLFLGVPFNWTGAAALLRMVAQQVDLTPGELIWCGGDVHLYVNHLDQARKQLQREPRAFPTLELRRRPDSIDDYRIDDFQLDGYDPHPPLPAEVAL